ncbi:MFS transporter [Nonomuraea sp. NPDC049695]|uniref:MFS transporter n=1 Tax=Nonomuraea sp. NPDC049695 TaxID=3154734 RepID=UPI00341F9F1B
MSNGIVSRAAASQPVPGPRNKSRLTLLTCCFSLFMAQLDATAVNVALPSIGKDLGGGISDLQWVVDAYVLVLACLGLSGGGIGDRYGRRRVYRIGLIVFSLASLGCGLAPTLGVLIAFRMVQAAGASMLMPVTLSIITNTFVAPAARTRAIGTWMAAGGVAAGVGPLIGGALTSALGWQAIFWINVPVGALALTLTRLYVTESRAAERRSLDIAGQAFLGCSLAALSYALIEAPRVGWASTLTLMLLAGAGLGALCFVAVEFRTDRPLIEPRYFRDRAFAGAAGIAVLTYLAVMGAQFLSSLYLQQVRGLSPPAAGAMLLPTSVALAAASPLAGRLTARYGPRPVVVAATVFLVGGLALLAETTPSTSPAFLIIAYLLIGVGWGSLNPPLTGVAVNTMPRDQAGVASAAVGASRQLGAVLGVAVMGSLTTTLTRTGLEHRVPHPEADPATLVMGGGQAARAVFTSATHVAYAAGAGAAVAAMIVALATMPHRARARSSS